MDILAISMKGILTETMFVYRITYGSIQGFPRIKNKINTTYYYSYSFPIRVFIVSLSTRINSRSEFKN